MSNNEIVTQTIITFNLRSKKGVVLSYSEDNPDMINITIDGKRIDFPECLKFGKIGICENRHLIENILTMEENGLLDYLLNNSKNNVFGTFG